MCALTENLLRGLYMFFSLPKRSIISTALPTRFFWVYIFELTQEIPVLQQYLVYLAGILSHKNIFYLQCCYIENGFTNDKHFGIWMWIRKILEISWQFCYFFNKGLFHNIWLTGKIKSEGSAFLLSGMKINQAISSSISCLNCVKY